MTDGSISPYAGRWVARVRGKIVAQGDTPEQALLAARQSRHKEKTEIIFMLALPPLLKKIMEALPAEQELYLVGGAVRDLLLAREFHDLDFAVPAGGIALARKLAHILDADFLVLDDIRDTGRVIVHEDGARFFLDFAVYRGADLTADLCARDFTINALAFNPRAETLIDPTGGGKDLRAKTIRACAPTAFSDDPVRVLRAVRQAAAFDFRIDKDTRAWMKPAVSQLPRISPERLRDELFKMLDGRKANACIMALEMLGVFPYLLPELVGMKGVAQSEPHVHDVWRHTLAVLDYLDQIVSALRVGYDAEQTNDMFTGLLGLRLGRYRERFARHLGNNLNVDRSQRALLFFAALYHDACKPQTKSVEESGRIRFFDHEIRGAEAAVERLRAFNLSTDEIQRVEKIILHHMRMHAFASRLQHEKQTPSRKAIYRFFRDSGDAGIDLILLALADIRATYAHALTIETWTAYLDVARILLENYWERPAEVVAPPRLVDGNALMSELKLAPGKIVGQLLEAIRENQAAGKIETREHAFAFARAELEKLN